MNDELRVDRKRRIQQCLEKVRFFCLYDAFCAYDTIGQRYKNETDLFRDELLDAMNKAMRARSCRASWRPFLNRPLAALAAIPNDTDLVDSMDAEYCTARQALKEYYLHLTVTPGITDMAASKMLFLKRPRLTAISDSYIRTVLDIQDPDTYNFPLKESNYTERVLRVSDRVREVGKLNMEFLTWLQMEMKPIMISKARLIDILIWVDMAIAQGHKMWSREAKSRGWSSMGPQYP